MELAARIAELEGGYRTFITPGGQSALALINLAFAERGRPRADPRQHLQPAPPARATICCAASASTSDLLSADDRRGHRRADRRADAARVVREPRLDHDGGAGRAGDRRGGASRGRDAWRSTTPTRPASTSTRSRTASTSRRRRSPSTSAGTATCCSAPSPCATRRTTSASAARCRRSAWPCRPTSAASRCAGCRRWRVRLERARALDARGGALARRSARRSRRVLHPALPSCPGHELWRRDFTGSTSVFSVEFMPRHAARAGARVRGRARAVRDRLELGRRDQSRGAGESAEDGREGGARGRWSGSTSGWRIRRI